MKHYYHKKIFLAFLRQFVPALGMWFMLALTCFSKPPDYSELENVLENIARETEASSSLEEIDFLIKNPIIISESTPDELSQVPGFPIPTAVRIIELAAKNEKISFEMIKDSLNLSEEQYYFLKLCTVITEKKKWKKENLYYRMRTSAVISPLNKSPHDAQTGGKEQIYNRITYISDNIKAGLLTDKDAFEVKTADFYGGWLQAEFSGFELTAGDYYLETGMGSVLWKNFGMRKGSEVISPALQKGRGINPYRSTIDNLFFRGAGISKIWSLSSFNRLKTTAWISHTPKSGNVNDSGSVTSLYSSGYFRTESEAEKYHTFVEKGSGINIEYSIPVFTFGASAQYLEYDKRIESSSKAAFFGKKGMLTSVYSFMNYRSLAAGVEFSNDARNNIGIKSGLQFYDNKYEAALNFRHFPVKYRSPYSYNFGESYMPVDETGFYAGFRWKGIKNADINTYVDFFGGRSAGYSMDTPVRGMDFFSEAQVKINKKNVFVLRLRNENKTDAVKDNDEISRTIQKNRSSMRAEHKFLLKQGAYFRLRGEFCLVSFDGAESEETGWAGFAEFRYRLTSFLKTGVRYSLFDTESYHSAIWQFEAFVPGTMYSAPLYGSGMRWNLYFSVELLDYADIWLKYSETVKNNTDSMGSGITEITGASKRSITLQAEISI